MTRVIFVLLLSSFSLFAPAQTAGKILSNIRTIPQADSLVQANPDASLLTINIGDEDNDRSLASLYNKKAGSVTVINNVHYKILEIKNEMSYRANYIWLSSSMYSKEQADELRKNIIAKYKSGASFYQLVQDYNTDSNPLGDTKKYDPGKKVKPFATAVLAHKKNDIFTIDTSFEGEEWYFVVLKTFDNKMVKRMTVVGMK